MKSTSGLHAFLERIKKNPAKENLVDRYLILVSETEDSAYKADSLLQLAKIIIDTDPLRSLQIIWQVYQNSLIIQADRYVFLSIQLFIDIFIKLEKPDEAQQLEIELAKYKDMIGEDVGSNNDADPWLGKIGVKKHKSLRPPPKIKPETIANLKPGVPTIAPVPPVTSINSFSPNIEMEKTDASADLIGPPVVEKLKDTSDNHSTPPVSALKSDEGVNAVLPINISEHDPVTNAENHPHQVEESVDPLKSNETGNEVEAASIDLKDQPHSAGPVADDHVGSVNFSELNEVRHSPERKKNSVTNRYSKLNNSIIILSDQEEGSQQDSSAKDLPVTDEAPKIQISSDKEVEPGTSPSQSMTAMDSISSGESGTTVDNVEKIFRIDNIPSDEDKSHSTSAVSSSIPEVASPTDFVTQNITDKVVQDHQDSFIAPLTSGTEIILNGDAINNVHGEQREDPLVKKLDRSVFSLTDSTGLNPEADDNSSLEIEPSIDDESSEQIISLDVESKAQDNSASLGPSILRKMDDEYDILSGSVSQFKVLERKAPLPLDEPNDSKIELSDAIEESHVIDPSLPNPGAEQQTANQKSIMIKSYDPFMPELGERWVEKGLGSSEHDKNLKIKGQSRNQDKMDESVNDSNTEKTSKGSEELGSQLIRGQERESSEPQPAHSEIDNHDGNSKEPNRQENPVMLEGKSTSLKREDQSAGAILQTIKAVLDNDTTDNEMVNNKPEDNNSNSHNIMINRDDLNFMMNSLSNQFRQEFMDEAKSMIKRTMKDVESISDEFEREIRKIKKISQDQEEVLQKEKKQATMRSQFEQTVELDLSDLSTSPLPPAPTNQKSKERSGESGRATAISVDHSVPQLTQEVIDQITLEIAQTMTSNVTEDVTKAVLRDLTGLVEGQLANKLAIDVSSNVTRGVSELLAKEVSLDIRQAVNSAIDHRVLPSIESQIKSEAKEPRKADFVTPSVQNDRKLQEITVNSKIEIFSEKAFHDFWPSIISWLSLDNSGKDLKPEEYLKARLYLCCDTLGIQLSDQEMDRLYELVVGLMCLPSLGRFIELTRLFFDIFREKSVQKMLDLLCLPEWFSRLWLGWIDIQLEQGQHRRCMYLFRRRVDANVDLETAVAVWERLPKIWTALQLKGFSWSKEEGIMIFVNKLNAREEITWSGLQVS